MILNFFPDDPRARAAFTFDHAQAHLALIGTMAGKANALPPMDPMLTSSIGAPDLWSLDHQFAHDAAGVYLNVAPSLPLPDEEAGASYWTFVNDQEHQALATAALRLG